MATTKGRRSELQRQFEDLVSRFMASDQGQRLIGWYEHTSVRERIALRVAGVLLLLLAVYALVLAPAIGYGERAHQRLHQERELLAWLRAHEASAPGATGAAPQTEGQPVAPLVNSSAQEQGITIRRYEPAGEDGVRVWLEGASFAAVIKWLYQLEGTHGIEASEFSFEREGDAGFVNARLTLRG